MIMVALCGEDTKKEMHVADEVPDCGEDNDKEWLETKTGDCDTDTKDLKQEKDQE
jgi:hypothetical protein